MKWVSLIENLPYIYASYQVSIHLAKRFQRTRFFRNRPIRNKNCWWQSYLLMDRDKMSNLYREPSYQVSVHLAKRFKRRRFFRNRPIRNKNCLWRPCLLMDRDKMNTFYRRPSIDASYQVSVHLAKGFQRRRLKCEKLTDDGCQRLTLPLARWAKILPTFKYGVATKNKGKFVQIWFENLFPSNHMAELCKYWLEFAKTIR